MSSDKGARRREIEDVTAARLAEIVAAAERAAKQVIDEAEAEARARLSDAEDEAGRIVAERLATLAELTAEVDAQAEALKLQSEALQRALAEVRAEVGAPKSSGGSSGVRGGEALPSARRPSSPSLTVVGRTPEEAEEVEEPVAPVMREARAAEASELAADFENGSDPAGGGPATPAGARLLATQMAVSGSSRAEIDARLRHGFEIEDTASILDAILGPEK